VPNLKNEAERLRIGIRGGWIPVSDAIAWADRVISDTPDPAPALLDLALAANRPRHEVVDVLTRVPGASDANDVMRECLADLLAAVERQPNLARDAARWLYFTACDGGLPAGEFGHEPIALDDEFALAEQGYGSERTARERLLRFLREHARPAG
jgi:hypothetical protein